MNLLNQPATLILRTQTGPEDRYGTPTWVESTSRTVCHLQPRESTENMPVPIGTWRGWFPAGTPIDQSDAVLMDDGRKFEFVGPPRLWVNPRTGAQHHIEVDLNEVPA